MTDEFKLCRLSYGNTDRFYEIKHKETLTEKSRNPGSSRSGELWVKVDFTNKTGMILCFEASTRLVLIIRGD